MKLFNGASKCVSSVYQMWLVSSSSEGRLAAAAAAAAQTRETQSAADHPGSEQILTHFPECKRVWQPAGQQGSWLVLSRLAGRVVGCCTPRRIHNHLDFNLSDLFI